ncbi:hypothetical protein ACLOJK_019496 [Asimina triloba]
MEVKFSFFHAYAYGPQGSSAHPQLEARVTLQDWGDLSYAHLGRRHHEPFDYGFIRLPKMKRWISSNEGKIAGRNGCFSKLPRFLGSYATGRETAALGAISCHLATCFDYTGGEDKRVLEAWSHANAWVLRIPIFNHDPGVAEGVQCDKESQWRSQRDGFR